ncbi:hypothetical protein Pmar_PMAR024214, partial [Perkinsus marinus ATCC 50983]
DKAELQSVGEVVATAAAIEEDEIAAQQKEANSSEIDDFGGERDTPTGSIAKKIRLTGTSVASSPRDGNSDSVTESVNDTETLPSPEPPAELWCVCKKPDDGSYMVGCDRGDKCKVQWWHPQCAKDYIAKRGCGLPPPENEADARRAHFIYGLNVSGPEMAMLVKKVISLSIATAVVVIITTILGDVLFHYVSSGTFFSVVVGLLVPACGYYGAKNNDRNLIGMFCACGLCGAIWAVLQIVSGVGLVSFLKVVVEYCGPHGETKKSGGPFECEDVTKDWSDAQYDDAKHLVDIAAWFITGVILSREKVRLRRSLSCSDLFRDMFCLRRELKLPLRRGEEGDCRLTKLWRDLRCEIMKWMDLDKAACEEFCWCENIVREDG